MNLELAEHIPIFAVLEFAAQHNCQIVHISGSNYSMVPADKKVVTLIPKRCTGRPAPLPPSA